MLNLHAFALENDVVAADIAVEKGVEKQKVISDFAKQLSESEQEDYINIISKIARKRILEEWDTKPRKNKYDFAARIDGIERYKAYRKYNFELIAYMRSRRVNITSVYEYLDYSALGDRLKKERLNKEQAIAFLDAVDEISKLNMKMESGHNRDVWGRRILYNKDIRKHASYHRDENGKISCTVAFSEIARELKLREYQLSEMLRTELPEDKKEEIMQVIDNIRSRKNKEREEWKRKGWCIDDGE